MVRPCLSPWYAAEDHTTGLRGRKASQRKTTKSWKDNIKEWTGQSISSLLCVAEDRRRWAAITAEASVWVLQWCLGVTGFDWLIDWLIDYLISYYHECTVTWYLWMGKDSANRWVFKRVDVSIGAIFYTLTFHNMLTTWHTQGFKCLRKTPSVPTEATVWGRLFHTTGPATAKARARLSRKVSCQHIWPKRTTKHCNILRRVKHLKYCTASRCLVLVGRDESDFLQKIQTNQPVLLAAIDSELKRILIRLSDKMSSMCGAADRTIKSRNPYQR